MEYEDLKKEIDTEEFEELSEELQSYYCWNINRGLFIKGGENMKIKKGDYFDLYQDGECTKRIIATTDSYDNRYVKNYCEGIVLTSSDKICIDADREIKKIIGNIYDN